MCGADVDSDDLTTFSILEYGEASAFNKFDSASMSPMSSMSIVGFDTGKLCANISTRTDKPPTEQPTNYGPFH